jgi:hypothetical protein
MSFLKGFMSLFDWMTPKYKNYDEFVEEFDENMQDFYEKNGWGKYQNPLVCCDNDLSYSQVDKLLKEYLNKNKDKKFEPHAYYNQDLDKINVCWKDHQCVVKPLNENIHICISQENGGEIVGVNILNAKKLLKEKK